MNWTGKLQEFLAWISSHASKLRRKGFEPPNHLSNAQLHLMLLQGGQPASTYADEHLMHARAMPIVLTPDGRLEGEVWLKPDLRYRLEIRDSEGEILFTHEDA